ncbi:helix-turn-helix domain-containing protein [Paenibacillus sp. KACC 21273]|uniref:PucR family transcriptional regulator n=1 Tax=Paenibacillus sp. KACC 21273 TaxID=3025665 RepID=UPI002366A83C|nr:helix-turn-helix domain-containing protein [Paenibacillus sp. KACC 21273]WDF50784.1 helix-turn-helix domain-containing protein [Paenibacillus sp. KACC 21273]
MHWSTLKEHIESIIDYRIEEQSVALKDWEADTYQAGLEESGWIAVKQDLAVVTLWQIQPKAISPSNSSISEESLDSDHQQVIGKLKSLLELLLPAFTASMAIGNHPSSLSIREQGIQELSTWMMEQLDSGQSKASIPNGYLLKERLTSSMIPFLLVADSVQTGTLATKELEKLLYSYFGGEVLLLPLSENEWFILTNRELIEDSSDLKQSSSRDANVEIEDTEEDILMEFSLGLYELIASEWVGIFHIGVSKPIIPSEKLLYEVSLLKETVALGRLFHVKDHIHLPWELSLERLLYRIPDEDRADFVARADRYSDMLDDEETVATLETFFKMDCNVSETAKQLYIHRNTLLYRLDKIKQETELDVRKFEDAVLMKLTLLLYKVTKS